MRRGGIVYRKEKLMDQFRAAWKKIDGLVFLLVRHACAVILGALVVVVFYIFLGRYLPFLDSPMWGEPFSLLCLVWLSLLGSALVVRKNEHLRVTMFDDKLGKTGLALTEILSTICIFAFSLFLIIHGTQLAKSGAANNMAGVNVSYAVMYISLPVTGVLNIFALIGEWAERSAAK